MSSLIQYKTNPGGLMTNISLKEDSHTSRTKILFCYSGASGLWIKSDFSLLSYFRLFIINEIDTNTLVYNARSGAVGIEWKLFESLTDLVG